MSSTRRPVRASFSMSFAILVYGPSSTRRISFPPDAIREIIDEAFASLGDSIVIAHAKDRDRNFQACAAGKGILDFEYYLRCAKQSGFTGPLIMHGLDEIDVAFAREFLRRTLANVGFIS